MVKNVLDARSSYGPKLHHDFLKHYEVGRTDAAEDKPVTIITVRPINIYEIRFENHSSDYDFFNSEQVVDKFLFNVFNVRNKVERLDTDFFIRCALFSILGCRSHPNKIF